MMDLDDQLTGAQAKKNKTNATAGRTDATVTGDAVQHEAITIVHRRVHLREDVTATAVLNMWGA